MAVAAALLEVVGAGGCHHAAAREKQEIFLPTSGGRRWGLCLRCKEAFDALWQRESSADRVGRREVRSILLALDYPLDECDLFFADLAELHRFGRPRRSLRRILGWLDRRFGGPITLRKEAI